MLALESHNMLLAVPESKHHTHLCNLCFELIWGKLDAWLKQMRERSRSDWRYIMRSDFIRFFVPNLFQWELVGLQPTEKMGSSFVAHLEACAD